MDKIWLKGIRGEIVRLDAVERFRKVRDEKSGSWEVWAVTRQQQTQIFEGDKDAVDVFMGQLCDAFDPLDLSNSYDRNVLRAFLKTEGGT